MGKPDLESILAERLRLTQMAFEAAKANFSEVMSDLPSELPHPDGMQRIRNVGYYYRYALNSYAVAMQQFNEFVLHRTVPRFLPEASDSLIGQRQREERECKRVSTAVRRLISTSRGDRSAWRV
jgi:hypothetical protein